MGHDKTTTKGESMEWKHPSYYKELKRKRQEDNLVLVQRTNFNGQMTHKKMGLGRTLMRRCVLSVTGVISL